jgi:hypothetical protein
MDCEVRKFYPESYANSFCYKQVVWFLEKSTEVYFALHEYWLTIRVHGSL